MAHTLNGHLSYLSTSIEGTIWWFCELYSNRNPNRYFNNIFEQIMYDTKGGRGIDAGWKRNEQETSSLCDNSGKQSSDDIYGYAINVGSSSSSSACGTVIERADSRWNRWNLRGMNGRGWRDCWNVSGCWTDGWTKRTNGGALGTRRRSKRTLRFKGSSTVDETHSVTVARWRGRIQWNKIEWTNSSQSPIT